MWYVIQTKSGREDFVLANIEKHLSRDTYSGCFIALYEEVRHRAGKSRILFRRLFPGYIFCDTDSPKEFFSELRTVKEFTRILGAEEDDGEKIFIPVSNEDTEFLKSILDEGILHVSYVETFPRQGKTIKKIIGPLAGYKNHIRRIDIRRREAVAEMDIFGKRRTVCFGLWSEEDPKIPWLEKKKLSGETAPIDGGMLLDIGIYPGDKVTDTTGIYEGYEFTVKSVNPTKRTVTASIELLGALRPIELYVDDVEVVKGCKRKMRL